MAHSKIRHAHSFQFHKKRFLRERKKEFSEIFNCEPKLSQRSLSEGINKSVIPERHELYHRRQSGLMLKKASFAAASTHAHREGIHQADVILRFDLFAHPQIDNLRSVRRLPGGSLSARRVSGRVASKGQSEQNVFKDFLPHCRKLLMSIPQMINIRREHVRSHTHTDTLTLGQSKAKKTFLTA